MHGVGIVCRLPDRPKPQLHHEQLSHQAQQAHHAHPRTGEQRARASHRNPGRQVSTGYCNPLKGMTRPASSRRGDPGDTDNDGCMTDLAHQHSWSQESLVPPWCPDSLLRHRGAPAPPSPASPPAVAQVPCPPPSQAVADQASLLLTIREPWCFRLRQEHDTLSSIHQLPSEPDHGVHRPERDRPRVRG